MPVVKLDYDLADVETGFSPLPTDQYEAVIDEVELGESQSGNAKLVVVWKIMDGEFEGRKIYDHVPLHVGWRVKPYAELAGIEKGSKLDTEAFKGLEAILDIRQREGMNGDPVNEIKKITPM